METKEGKAVGARPRRWDREITLLAVSIFVLSLFFVLPRNSRWVADRILPYWNDLRFNGGRSTEEWRAIRYKKAYSYSKDIAGHFGNKNGVLVLVPPRAYFKQYGVDYPVPEPAVFYYYAGLKTTWADSPMAVKANWIVSVKDGEPVVEPVRSAAQLKDSIASFTKWDYQL